LTWLLGAGLWNLQAHPAQTKAIPVFAAKTEDQGVGSHSAGTTIRGAGTSDWSGIRLSG